MQIAVVMTAATKKIGIARAIKTISHPKCVPAQQIAAKGSTARTNADIPN